MVTLDDAPYQVREAPGANAGRSEAVPVTLLQAIAMAAVPSFIAARRPCRRLEKQKKQKNSEK